MQQRKRTITFYEYRGFKGADGLLTNKISDLGLPAEELLRLREISEKYIPGRELFEFTSNSIRAKSFVGVLNFGDVRIEILPKLLTADNGLGESNQAGILKNLMFMLSYTHALNIYDSDLSFLGKDFDKFIEAYIGIFSERLCRHLLRYGVPKHYIENESNLNYIKGRIVFSRNSILNSSNQSKNYCEYSEFSEDNPMSCAFKFVSVSLLRLTRELGNERRLQYCIGLLDGVNANYVMPGILDRIQHGKPDPNFLGLIQLTKMFLKKLRPEFTSANIEVFALIFDMNELFEEFIFQALHKNSQELNITVRSQKKKRLVTAERDLISTGIWKKQSLFDTYSDIEVSFKDRRPTLIIDTKYKLVGHESQHGYGISNADIYQVLAYKQIHSNIEHDSNVFLLYPRYVKDLYMEFQVSGSKATFLAGTINLSRDLKSEFPHFLDELDQLLRHNPSKQVPIF